MDTKDQIYWIVIVCVVSILIAFGVHSCSQVVRNTHEHHEKMATQGYEYIGTGSYIKRHDVSEVHNVTER